MTTSNHTPIATGAAANASTFNTPLGSLDAAIGDEAALTTTVKTSVVAAINELDAGKLESGASAALIANTPKDGISAVTVQAAIDELDDDKQPIDADLTAIAALSPSNDDVIQRKSGAWTNRTMAELKVDLVLTAANVANIATATVAATNVQDAITELDGDKANTVHTHTVSAITDQSSWKLDDFGTPDDNTDLNASSTRHGLLAKLSGVAGYFMDGLGAWVRAFVSIMWSGSGNFQAKYINFKGSAVTGVSYNATLDSVDVTITGGSGAGASALTDLTDVDAATPSDNDVLSYDLASSKWINVAAGSGHTIQDEGVNVTNRNTMNFVGAGVTVADVSSKTTVTVPGSYPCQGRLTLTTGAPVTTADVTAATTVYFTPYNGNIISLFDGTYWKEYKFTELSLSIAGYTASKNYDIFAYDNSGTITLESCIWTDDTTRATAIVATQDGVYCKSGVLTRRYLGTIRITATAGQCEDSKSDRFVWNLYNKVRKTLHCIENTSHVYNGAARLWNNSTTNNLLQIVIGLSSAVEWSYSAWVTTPAGKYGNLFMYCDGANSGKMNTNRSGNYVNVNDNSSSRLLPGFHYYSAYENGNDAAATYTYLVINAYTEG